MTGSTSRTAAEELAHILRQLRLDADPRVSGAALARRLGEGFSQSKVSRIEGGVLVPTPMDAGRMAVALGADHEARRRVIRLARDVAEERAGLTPVRVALLRQAPRLQRRIRQREQRAARVATFHPAIIPGLLQTEGYMRSMIGSAPVPYSDADIETWLAERRRRQADRSDRPAIQLVSESALCWGVAGAEVMVEQCDHIARLTRDRPAWEIGVIPRLVPPGAPVDYPPNGFDLYDDDTVLIGTTAGNALVTDRPTVDSHRARLARLRNLAVYGAAARDALARIAEDYRSAPVPARTGAP